MEIISRKTTGRVYDAVVVGSGAAGGMAAYVMANAGMNVLALEAGPKLDLYNDFKTHAWPDENPYSTPEGKPFDWARARAVGGRTLVCGLALSMRASEYAVEQLKLGES